MKVRISLLFLTLFSVISAFAINEDSDPVTCDAIRETAEQYCEETSEDDFQDCFSSEIERLVEENNNNEPSNLLNGGSLSCEY